MDTLYKEFSQRSSIISEALSYFLNLDTWQNHHGFDLVVVDERIWSCELLLNVINQKFKIAHCTILKIDANVNYNWHTDSSRGLAINMLVRDGRSHCLFGFEQDSYNDKFVELKYNPHTFYLFNTQHRHSVINFDSPRYLFSVEFAEDKTQLTYNEVYNWCNEQGMFK